MIKLRPFDVVNIIARISGEEAQLTVRNKVGNPTRIPVRLSNVDMETSTDGTTVKIQCDLMLPETPLELRDMYPPAMIDPRLEELAEKFARESVFSADEIRRAMYSKRDVEATKELHDRMSLTIKNVIHSDPATIVFWMDGTKTVVKAVNEDYDPEKGIAMAFVKKMFGNKGNYFNQIKKWLPKEEETVETKAEESPKVEGGGRQMSCEGWRD